MNASKEEARKARANLLSAADCLDDLESGPVDATKRHLAKVDEFLEAAIKKLPSEASFTKEAARRTARSK